ncbi:MAG: rhomboid family intramembrane serine protease [Deltaproteobacteria bacterium]|nr:rhomboid family intramembrane serine protease [Deltaproteobacteria bacterium]
MIPLRDTIPSSSFPVVTIGLIILNTLIFFYQISLGPREEQFVLHYGFVPAVYLHTSLAEPFSLLARFGPMFSSMFLHGGWLHLIGNMWTLWIFGDNVEDRLGKVRLLLYYIASGLAAVYLHYLTERTSGLPVIGASGAIAGVMGGYFVLFPRARILTLLPIFIFIQIVTIPAVVFLALWFLGQLLSGVVATSVQTHGGVAWWAHVGGFVAGALLILPRRRSSPQQSPWSSEHVT